MDSFLLVFAITSLKFSRFRFGSCPLKHMHAHTCIDYSVYLKKINQFEKIQKLKNKNVKIIKKTKKTKKLIVKGRKNNIHKQTNENNK